MHPHQDQQPVPAQQPVYYVPLQQQQPTPQVVSTTQGQWVLLVLIFIIVLVQLGFTLYLFGVVHDVVSAVSHPFGG